MEFHHILPALLRREGLYFSSLKTRLEQRRTGELVGLAQKKRGPAPPVKKNPLAAKVAALEREVSRQTARAERAEALVELQKSLGDPWDRTEAERRAGVIAIVIAQKDTLGVTPVCATLAVPRATYYRWQQPKAIVPAPPRRVPRALPPEERRIVLAMLKPPALPRRGLDQQTENSR